MISEGQEQWYFRLIRFIYGVRDENSLNQEQFLALSQIFSETTVSDMLKKLQARIMFDIPECMREHSPANIPLDIKFDLRFDDDSICG